VLARAFSHITYPHAAAQGQDRHKHAQPTHKEIPTVAGNPAVAAADAASKPITPARLNSEDEQAPSRLDPTTVQA